MLTRGHGWPPGIAWLNGGLSSVHGQPILSVGEEGSWDRVGQRMLVNLIT
jgi:hypothetical protein